MNKQLEKYIAGLRKYYRYNDEFDIFLATTIDEEPAITKRSLYDLFASTLEKLGKRVFLPCRDVSIEWGDSYTAEIIRQIVIPSSDLIVAYVGVPSTDVGIMIERAKSAQRSIIFIYERNSTFHREILPIPTLSEITFTDEQQALRQLEKVVKDFYLNRN